MPKTPTKPWYTYILLCSDNTLYTGITNDLAQRLKAHQDGKGAKYTRSHGAKQIVYSKAHPNHHDAAVHETEIKKLSRKEKVKLTLDWKTKQKAK